MKVRKCAVFYIKDVEERLTEGQLLPYTRIRAELHDTIDEGEALDNAKPQEGESVMNSHQVWVDG